MDQLEFAKRRTLLLEQIEDNSIVLISSSSEFIRNNDCFYPYRQDSDFFYLTGFEEPQAFLILIKENNQAQYILLNREKNYQEELWEGLRAGQEGACELYGADESYPISQLTEISQKFLANKRHIYYRVAKDHLLDKSLSKWLSELQKQIRKGITAPTSIHDISDVLGEMRLIKSTAEINIMRRVGEISANAHKKVMQAAPTCEYEYQLQAKLNFELMNNGCQQVAYDSIVASGANACILHYTANKDFLADDELILIDAGGELENYAADITRTFPKKGKFTESQKAIYQIVLDAQVAGIALIKPGVLWPKIQEKMVEIIARGLLELGLLDGSLEDVLKDKSYQKFYMHNSGHWLGLDVHDQGAYKENGQWRALKEGMVLTVEPGIYIADHHQEIDSRWHNIGVRIEDDILVTKDGYENLTEQVPKEIVQIEALIKNESNL